MHTPYAELHCHSNFSFLDGASHPEELVAEASRLGMSALAITDHDGLYAAVRFSLAAREAGLPTVFGAELSLSPNGPRTGTPDPVGSHLVVLARDPTGYASLSRAIAEAHLAGGAKGLPRFSLEELAGRAAGHWLVLSGCRKGLLPATLMAEGPAAAGRVLDRLAAEFGKTNVAVEIWDHGDPLDIARNDALATLAVSVGVDTVATNNVHYAIPSRWRLSTALAAVRSRRVLSDLDGWIPPTPSACLRSGDEQERRLARWPGTVARAAELGRSCAFDLRLVSPGLPDFPVPSGHSELSWLSTLASRGAAERYGPRGSERVPGAWAQIDHELEVIGKLGYAGYFLVVWDIVEYCRRNDIYCQGRGSAANSAVCYALGITRADAVALGLLFERFLSPERDGPPDIDVDIESSRREDVISYVYARYGRHHAAQVGSIVSYRHRSAARDMQRALGISPGGPERAGQDSTSRLSDLLASEVIGFPRHLGLHSGGMVICGKPVVEVCPVEWARRPGRTALQWDKDDCAAVGMVKFDLLGLGMLDALHRAVNLISESHGIVIDLAYLPQEDAVYDMLCRADTVGVFQVESRAQMATLPRVLPRCFADLVIEVALIRPGPIQGGSVHPYIRRRQGAEAPESPHSLLDDALGKTLGVPLFQEQLMRIAIDAAGFTPAEADELRQAMSAKRSTERMVRLRDRLFAGMHAKGITQRSAEEIYAKLSAFANFGFPESHAISFAYLVYSSAWLKLHYPAAFLAALLDAQPMGFWSPNTLVADAKRHGVEVRRPHVNTSGSTSRLEWGGGHRSQPALRLGLAAVRTIGREAAGRIAQGQPYSSIEELSERAGLSRAELEALATAGALDDLPPIQAKDHPYIPGSPMGCREALWAAGPVSHGQARRLPGIVSGGLAPPLVPAGPLEQTAYDMWATGISVGPTAIELARKRLTAMGVATAASLVSMPDGSKITVGGMVTHRQQPASARGAVFLNIEDETGLVNVVFSRGAWARWGGYAGQLPAMLVRGRLEIDHDAVSIIAEHISPLEL
jgi:error-prone DNA polymerase